MPIYTYKCSTCGNTQERIEPITTPTETTHPCPVFGRESTLPPNDQAKECGGTLHRVPSVPAPAVFNCSMPTYQKKKT